jgi:hypothetical protein
MRIADYKLDMSADYQHKMLQQREVKELGRQLKPGEEQSVSLSAQSLSATESAANSYSIAKKEKSLEEQLRDTLLDKKQLHNQLKLNLGKQEKSTKDQNQPTTSTTESDTVGSEDEEELSLPSQLRLMKALIEAFTGIKITLPKQFNPQSSDQGATTSQTPDSQSSAPTGNQEDNRAVQVTTLSLEQESVSFSAKGAVTTSSGKQINLDLGFALDYHLLSANERLTSAGKLKDPLVLNLDGLVAGFTQGTFNFDIDADGNKEQLAKLDKGSAFLAMDRNGNGQIDDGKELFGAQSGNGFADLAALDQDGNGVLDEGDSQFAQLRLYRPGEALMTLGEKKVGAIFLQSAATEFQHLGTTSNTSSETSSQEASSSTAQTSPTESPAVLRQTGIYITEDGKAGTVQQLDLRV